MHYKYTCKHCSKRFELGQAYSNHIKIHSSSLDSDTDDETDEPIETDIETDVESIKTDNESIEIAIGSTNQYCKQQFEFELELFKSCNSDFNKDSDADEMDDYFINQHYYKEQFESRLLKTQTNINETDETLNVEETIHQKMVCNYC